MTYSVKELFKTLQGEGGTLQTLLTAYSGSPVIDRVGFFSASQSMPLQS